MLSKKRFLRILGAVGLNLFYYGSILFFSILVIRIFLLASFKIPTDSMSPEVLPSDQILVHKWLYGAPIFDIFDATAGKNVPIRRVAGGRSIRRNDVLVFHYPYPAGRERIAMNMRSYYISNDASACRVIV